MIINEAEQDFWSSDPGKQWVIDQKPMDASMANLVAALLQQTDPQPGERVLDVGCGTGALSLAMGDAVGTKGSVLGLDISDVMVARAQERAKHAPQITFRTGDAQVDAFPEGPFDVITSRFGVMFFAEPIAAFRNFAQRLAPNGRLAFLVWGPREDNPWMTLPIRTATAILGSVPAPEPHAPGPFGLSDRAYLEDVLDASGLPNPGIEDLTIDLTHEGGAEGTASLAMRIGPATSIMREKDATQEDRTTIHANLIETFRPFETEGEMAIPARLFMITAG